MSQGKDNGAFVEESLFNAKSTALKIKTIRFQLDYMLRHLPMLSGELEIGYR